MTGNGVRSSVMVTHGSSVRFCYGASKSQRKFNQNCYGEGIFKMSNEQVAIGAVMVLLVGFLVVGWATERATRRALARPLKPKGRHPKNPKAPARNITFDCPGCRGESSKLRYDQITLVQTPAGYALVGVCRTVRIQEDGMVRPCGCALISADFGASAAAEFVNQGVVGEHSRLVIFRAELGQPDLVDKILRSAP
jgi:hypothetical protein